MKALLTATFFFFLTATALANTQEEKVEVVQMGIELELQITTNDVQPSQVARLYRFKNSRVKKALKFANKATQAKMA